MRNLSKLNHLQKYNKLELIQGAYFDKEHLKDVVENSDAVMTTIAPKPLSSVSDREMNQFKASFVELMTVLEALKINRFVHISGSTIRFKNETLSLRRKLLRLVMTTIARPAVRLKDFELQTMAESQLNWISIRSPRLQPKLDGSLVANAQKMPGGKVDVNQLANFMIDQVETDEWVQKTPFVATK